jgi:hypothetical protein
LNVVIVQMIQDAVVHVQTRLFGDDSVGTSEVLVMRCSLTNGVRRRHVHFDAVIEDLETVLVRTPDAAAAEGVEAQWNVRNDVSVGEKEKQK